MSRNQVSARRQRGNAVESARRSLHGPDAVVGDHHEGAPPRALTVPDANRLNSPASIATLTVVCLVLSGCKPSGADVQPQPTPVAPPSEVISVERQFVVRSPTVARAAHRARSEEAVWSESLAADRSSSVSSSWR
jgi:hypothetical protein